MRRHASGQSAVEFVLTAPLLFLLLFGLIQAAYGALVCFAVQRSALAAARHAARFDGTGGAFGSPRFQAYAALVPLASLHRSNLLAACLTQVDIQNNGFRVTAIVRYPMPLWVPMAGRLLGQSLIPPLDLQEYASVRWLRQAFRLAGKTPPDFSWEGVRLPFFRIIAFRAVAFREPRSEGSDS